MHANQYVTSNKALISCYYDVLSFATGKALNDGDLRKVYNALYKARTKWRPIGIQLDIEVSDLDDIEKRYFVTWGNDRCLEEMVRKWLKDRPNWEALIAALKSPQVYEGGIAYEIESVSPANCYMTGKGLKVARVGEEATAALHTLDLRDRECGKPIQNISCELVSCQGASTVKCSVKKGERSKYEIRYSSTTSGQHQLHVKVDGKHVKGSPFTVVVKVPIEKLGTPIRTIGGLNKPCGVVVDEGGDIIVAETGRHCVSIFSPRGEKIRSFGTQGSGPGQFNGSRCVAVDRDGSILVADSDNGCIQKFSSDGKFIKSVGILGNGPLQFSLTVGIAVSQEGRIYVCDSGNRRVQVLNPDLTFHSSFGSPGSDKGQLWFPWDVAFDSRGDVYVADYGNHRIQILTGDGQFLRKFGEKGSGDGELNYPASVTIDSDDMLFVADYGNHRVSVFTSQGQFVRTFGALGTEPGQFSYPCGITVDRHGLLYVSDNNHLQIF